MTALESYLCTYFNIPSKYLDVLSRKFVYRTLPKGEYFTRSGAYCEKLSFIKSGHLRIFEYEEGKDITQWISSKGELVTDLSSLFFHTPARRNIQALTDCELFTIEKESYRQLANIVPQWPELEKLFIAKCFLTLEDRVFGFLSLSAEQRFQQIFQYKKELFNEVPLHYLASMMGMSAETLSRIRNNGIS
ncbi:Crp/Fnr family transcriptional regulator [Echinicola jeungdonensis]|uniref:Crp/Fnr family transcriptional regulator n=1 Tax=Echinicola jeungdonensis TaxID=709343 RepID=A0ABV5J763_9BACT|nr:Crp/Fnr family transcriptional regulator [Echinicola jeungdonensis]MDN3669174.1 Crp/Fnr family transcriptional regulator [Echinicola jeungdonensis]